MDVLKLKALEKEITEKSEEQEQKQATSLIYQARVDVFVKLLDNQKSLPIERFSRTKEVEVLLRDSKKIVKELFKD